MLFFFVFIATLVTARHIPSVCALIKCSEAATTTSPSDEAGATDALDISQALRVAVSTTPSATEPTTLFTSTTTEPASGYETAPETTTPPPAPEGVIVAPDGSCVPQSFCVQWLTCGHRGGTCYDKNGCDGSPSTYQIPTCETPAPQNGFAKRREFIEERRMDA